jgi:hypothetical protein
MLPFSSPQVDKKFQNFLEARGLFRAMKTARPNRRKLA